MTNPLNGQEVRMPTTAAVVEHVFTLPMALAIVATACGWVALSNFFVTESPWQKLLQQVSTGMPLLIAQLGQMWHSTNVRNKMGIGNAADTQESKL